jgi:putative ABC transport system permease protein
MMRNDFRIGWRLLLKEPGYSAVVIAGLSLGFAACFLLLGFVRYCLSYNAALPDSAHTFVVMEKRNMLPRPDWQASAPPFLERVALDSGMPVTGTSARSIDVSARIDAHVLPLTLQVAERNYTDFFNVKAEEGDAAAALARPDLLVLNRETATRLFGNAHALGRILSIDGVAYTVGAILPDMPANTTVRFDALLGAGAHSFDPQRPGPSAEADWYKRASVYLRVGPGGSGEQLGALLQEAIARTRDAKMRTVWRGALPEGHLTSISVVSLSDVYFDAGLLAGRAGSAHGNPVAVFGLGALALLILLLASTNYVNLAAIRSIARQREIGVRKMLGAGRWRLTSQFAAESTIVAMGGVVLGLLLAWLALPLFSELVDRPLRGMFNAANVAMLLGLGLVVGAVSALYPAALALRSPVSETLHGRAGGETAQGQRLRRALTVFQFAVATALIGVTLAVSWQARYASQADPGFDAAPLLVLDLPGDAASAAAADFRAELARLPGIEAVAAMSEAVGRDGNKVVNTIQRPGQTDVQLEAKMVSANFFEVYRVPLLAGSAFAVTSEGKTTDVILNASAAALFGFASPQAAIGQVIGRGNRVVGIAPDLRYRTLRESPQPMVYRVDPAQEVLTVRASGSVAQARAQVEALWARRFPNEVLRLEPAGAVFAQNYADDQRLARMLATASVVATALAWFGIYVLSAYSVQRRSRELVLRKLHGARPFDIARLVGREFVLLFSVGVCIGLPFAALAMQRYLAGFVERAPLGAWPLLLAAVTVAVVALAATFRNTLSAMRLAPALALQ